MGTPGRHCRCHTSSLHTRLLADLVQVAGRGGENSLAAFGAHRCRPLAVPLAASMTHSAPVNASPNPSPVTTSTPSGPGHRHDAVAAHLEQFDNAASHPSRGPRHGNLRRSRQQPGPRITGAVRARTRA
jgi:hypothetical protein